MKNRQECRSYRKNIVSLGLLVTVILFGTEAFATPIFINEIHYDNVGGDSGEAIEIAGPAGSNLQDWKLLLYNGSGGGSYRNIPLTGSISDQESGFGTLSFLIHPIQNGGANPDGVALIDPGNAVIQFLSYEGFFTASNESAFGITSTDIGVSESSGTNIGHSLQLVGTGNSYEDFSWEVPSQSSFGGVNTGQSFTPIPNPEPGTFALMGLGLMGMLLFFRYKQVRKDDCHSSQKNQDQSSNPNAIPAEGF